MNTAMRSTLTRYIFLFIFFSIIGWFYEVMLAFLYGHGFVNRGFLLGPYLPLYGFGALLLILCLQKLMKHPIRIGRVSITPLIVFLLIVLLTTALEYAVGFLLETFFNQRFWDYSTYTYQIHGRICLSASIRFGVGGMVFLYLLLPLFIRVIKKIPSKQGFFLTIIVIVVLAADFIFTLYLGSVQGFDPVLAQPNQTL